MVAEIAVDELRFKYTNLVPPAARPGTNTNVVTIWKDGKNIKYKRQYVSSDGTVSENGIEHTFQEKDCYAQNIARQIHWGCCGWSAGGHEIWQLTEIIDNFLKSI